MGSLLKDASGDSALSIRASFPRSRSESHFFNARLYARHFLRRGQVSSVPIRLGFSTLILFSLARHDDSRDAGTFHARRHERFATRYSRSRYVRPVSLLHPHVARTGRQNVRGKCSRFYISRTENTVGLN